MNENRGPWYLLTGVVIGIALGVLYAWLFRPVHTKPDSLRPEFKDKYRAMIAVAYVANSDLARAKARLVLLKDPDVYQTLAEQTQRWLAGGGSLYEAQALGLLAIALGQGPTAIPLPVYTDTQASETQVASPQASPTPSPTAPPILTLTNTPITPSPTRSPTPTPTRTSTLQVTGRSSTTPAVAQTPSPTSALTPTPSPTPTSGAPFALEERKLACETNPDEPLIQVLAFDAARQPVPGVEVIITWEGGEERFYTGLKPEKGLGYADFSMTPGIIYTLRLANGGQLISDLIATRCSKPLRDPYWGVWALTFIQR